MQIISATEFMTLVKARRFEEIERKTVTGKVSFRGQDLPRDLRLLYVTFLGPVDFSDTRIGGTLDLSGCHFCRTLTLANAEIDGDLVLDDVVVEALARGGRGGNFDWSVEPWVVDARGILIHSGLSAISLVVHGDLNLADCRIGASTRFAGCEFHGPLYLSGAVIGGTLRVDRQENDVQTYIGGRFCGANMTVKGNLTLQGLKVTEDIDFTDLRAEAGVRIAGYEIGRGFALAGAAIGGDLWFEGGAGTDIRADLSGANMTVQGNLIFQGLRVQGDVDIWSATVEGNVFIEGAATPTMIRGNLHIGASRVRGHMRMLGITVDGIVKLYSATVGRLQIGHHNTAATEPGGCRFGALHGQGLIVEGDARLYLLNVTGAAAGSAAAVDFTHARINGRLAFWSASMFMKEGRSVANGAPEPEEHHSHIVGDVDLSGAVIAGACDLTNIVVDGAILLDDAEVKGDLHFHSAVSLLAEMSVQERARDLHARLADRAIGGNFALPRASVRRLSLAMIRCHKDVELTGLDLRATDEEVRSLSGYGCLTANGLEVAGHLWLHHRLDNERWATICNRRKNSTGNGVADGFPAAPDCDAKIPGSAGFQGATIGHFTVSASSFREEPKPDEDRETIERQRGLTLIRARIGHLEIVPLEVPAAKSCEKVFPVPVNLADIEVLRWDIKEEEDNRCAPYEQLLANDTLRRSTYIAVERSLRNRGFEAEADRIYRSMVRRGYTEARRGDPRPHHWLGVLYLRWRHWPQVLAPLLIAGLGGVLAGTLLVGAAGLGFWPWAVIGAVALVILAPLVTLAVRVLVWDWLLGFGSAPIRLGVAIVVLFLLSVVFVYSDVDNIGPTAEAEFLETLAEGGSDRPTDWGLWDAIAIGLKSHVPIVPWNMRNDWQLADQASQHLHVAGWEVNLPVRPEDFGILMMVLNFLAWPPFLAFALRRAFRHA